MPLSDALVLASQQQLNPMQEMLFQRDVANSGWAQQFAQRFGEQPNLNDPTYDYRKAWVNGLAPRPYGNDGGAQHWVSSTQSGEPLKSFLHPTQWMESWMQRTGQDPGDWVYRMKR